MAEKAICAVLTSSSLNAKTLKSSRLDIHTIWCMNNHAYSDNSVEQLKGRPESGYKVILKKYPEINLLSTNSTDLLKDYCVNWQEYKKAVERLNQLYHSLKEIIHIGQVAFSMWTIGLITPLNDYLTNSIF